MSVESALREATTGQVWVNQSYTGTGWTAEAYLKDIITTTLYAKDPRPRKITSAVEITPIDALIGLARICENELWKFELRIVEDKLQEKGGQKDVEA